MGESTIDEEQERKLIEIIQSEDSNEEEKGKCCWELMEDSRYSFDTLAEKLGLSEQKVREWTAYADSYLLSDYIVRFLFQEDEYSEAERMLLRVIELQPDNISAWILLGDTYEKQGMYSEAEPAYRKAIELKPDFFGLWIIFDKVLRAQEKWAEAEEEYRRQMPFIYQWGQTVLKGITQEITKAAWIESEEAIRIILPFNGVQIDTYGGRRSLHICYMGPRVSSQLEWVLVDYIYWYDSCMELFWEYDWTGDSRIIDFKTARIELSREMKNQDSDLQIIHVVVKKQVEILSMLKDNPPHAKNLGTHVSDWWVH